MNRLTFIFLKTLFSIGIVWLSLPVNAFSAVPVPLVNIPGYDQTTAENYDSQPLLYGDYTSNSFGYYVSIVYNFLLIASSIVAITMLVIAGAQYSLAQGDTGQVQKAKEKIKRVVVGVIIILLSYNIGYLIDPRIGVIKPLNDLGVGTIPAIDPDIGEPDGTDNDGSFSLPGDFVTLPVSGTGYYSVADEKIISQVTLDAFEIAAKAYNEDTRKNLKIKSASRSLASQANLLYDHCYINGDLTCGNVKVCNPIGNGSSWKTGLAETALSKLDIVTNIAQLGDIANCPHTSGVALDIWPQSSPGAYQGYVADMNDMIFILGENGFCRIKSEPWHFELAINAMSSGCTLDSSVMSTHPQSYNCSLFDFKKKCCVTAEDPLKPSKSMCSQ